ncbi:MAG: hypothetical protein II709_02230, partial [Ruminococcus sp.]|nr:hypothetical protein [Ruminococcus sp.]
MESNKLLIGVQFVDPKNKNENLVFELIVLRDLTLRQLMDGIKYGLAKKGDDPFYSRCRGIFEECTAAGDDGMFRKMTMTSYNDAISDRTKRDGRAVMTAEDMDKTLVSIGFISSTRLVFDPTERYRSYEINTSVVIPAFNPATDSRDGISFPDYNISTRQLTHFDNTPVELIPPSAPPQKQEQSIFFLLLPTIIMIGVTILSRILTSGAGSIGAVLLSASMSLVTVVLSVVNYIRQGSKYKKDLKKWRTDYENYINKTIAEILRRQETDAAKLDELYPDVNELFDESNPSHSVYGVIGAIFSRCQQDADFLTVRLGTSDKIPNTFEIKGSRRDVLFSSEGFRLKFDKVTLYLSEDEEYDNREDETFYLTNLPNYISEKYRYMKRAPMLFPMRQCGSLGIVAPNTIFSERLIQRMVFDLCFYQSPDDLQFIVLFPPTNDRSQIEASISNFKFMPHFRDLFPDRSQFVFDEQNAGMVFSSMLSVMGERAAAAGQGVKFPHIVFIVYHEYDIKEHAFAQYLPSVPADGKPYENKLGLTFIFPKLFKEHLPAYCDHVIEFTGEHSAALVPHDDAMRKTEFNFNVSPDWNARIYNTSKILSSLCYSRISQNGKVPSAVSLFELYG